VDFYARVPHVQLTMSQPTPTLITASAGSRNPTAISTFDQVDTTITETISISEASTIQRTPIQYQRMRSSPRRTTSAPTSSSVAPPHIMSSSVLGKRKRKQLAIALVPEAQQIFKGLTFFYVPNDDVSPVRRARIRKAREYGALWATIWVKEEITHIIVDKSLSYQDVVKFLKISSIPSSIGMVVDNYPLDCIQFRAILDPSQRQYRVTGHSQPPEDKTRQKPESQTSDKSLQLRPVQSKPGRWDYIPRRATPPRNESSTHSAVIILDARELSNESSPRVWLPPSSEVQVAIEPGENNSLSEAPSSRVQSRSPSIVGGDALDEMIRVAQKLKNLPLDEDDDDLPQSPSFAIESDALNHENRSPSPEKRRLSSRKHSHKDAATQENFSCMKGGTGKTDDSNPNARTIIILQEMADYYTRINDTWRPLAYRKCISSLKQQTTKIRTAEQAVKLPFVGQRLALKIEEIVTTDRLRRLENAKRETSDHVLQKFMGIYGVGFSQANKWLHSGYTTFSDLKAHANLTENQLLGIEHYDDFHTRIPRDEVTALATIIKATAATIDPEVEIIIGGSYRRGAASSGDIDCLVTKPNTSSSTDIFDFLRELVSRLISSGLLVAALAIPRSESGTKWHGCCILPGMPKSVWRRIDFLLVPATELGAALIYFTGNDIFNRSIRLLASKKGMRLNQRGLYKDVMRGPGRVKVNEGELVESADEKKIFATLGVPWRPPEQRIC
jgi:DNA polymerase IV